jgi:uridine kinase
MQPDGRATFVMGIAGGTGSGKSTVATNVAAALPPGSVVLLEHDWYYRDRSEIPLVERERINYDHPDAMETELLVAHLQALRAGQGIEVPQYDFRQHVRAREHRRIDPAPIVLLEGILVLADERLRAQMDVKLFVDTEADIRLMRRVRRDMERRGRTFDQVREQYYDTVRPMHLQFVEPSKRFADLIVPEGGENRAALEVIIGRLLHALG